MSYFRKTGDACTLKLKGLIHLSHVWNYCSLMGEDEVGEDEVLRMRALERLGTQECNILTILLIGDFKPLTIYLSDNELYIDI